MGIYLPGPDLLITNEHVVRDNATVVIGNQHTPEQLARVVYLDSWYDLAFLKLSAPLSLKNIPLAKSIPQPKSAVTTMGWHYGKPLMIYDGVIVDNDYIYNKISYLLHNASNTVPLIGGPLYNKSGNLLGINIYDAIENNGQTLSLSSITLQECIDRFSEGNGRSATRCFKCHKVIFEVIVNPKGHCPNCGHDLLLPEMIQDYQPEGVAATVESIIQQAGYDPRLSRRGPNLWSIQHGSADIQMSYHEESGLLTGDAYLCYIPDDAPADLYAFLLRENNNLPQLTFSTSQNEVVLSLLIYDRYLTTSTALPRFEKLFALADYYDNMLVEEYGAQWLTHGLHPTRNL